MIFIPSLMSVALTLPQSKPEERLPLPEPINLSGYYLCNGELANGLGYSSLVKISQNDDKETFRVIWYQDANNLIGLGKVINNRLYVSFLVPSNRGPLPAIAWYSIEMKNGNPYLKGKWTAGNGEIHKEELIHKELK